MKPQKPYRHRTLGSHRLHPETLAMSYGYDPKLSEGAVKAPLFMTSTFVFDSAQAGKEFFELAYGLRERRAGEDPGLIYSRINNPDLEILEDRLTLWDDAEDSLVFSSGMAAIATTIFAHVRPGDVVVHSEPVYGGSEFLLAHILPQFGVSRVGFAAGADAKPLADALEKAKKIGRVSVIYVETPANPTNDLVDIAACADAAKGLHAAQNFRPVVMVDNTFLGPLWQHPLSHGADLVLYSLTKYVGGHSDIIAGCALGSQAALAAVRGFRTILGTMCDPHTGWLLMRSLETLKLRMTEAATNAKKIADFLVTHPKVDAVHYLGHLPPQSPAGRLFAKQCLSPGSTFSIDVKGGEAAAFRFLDSLKLMKLAVSLGGTESLTEHPATMTHSDIPPVTQQRLGITPGMVRLSIGIENADDLIVDLTQALNAV